MLSKNIIVQVSTISRNVNILKPKFARTPSCFQGYHSGGSLDLGSTKELDWKDVVSKAEQIVGYPTSEIPLSGRKLANLPSFLNCRWLSNDEIVTAAIHLRNLVDIKHPFKNLLLGSKSDLQPVGLIVLLVSKAAGLNETNCNGDYHTGILNTQRVLAEIVEMKTTAHMIHRTICNLKDKDKIDTKVKDLLSGNKIVLLIGDYLLGNCLKQFGCIRNNDVTELISSGLRDLVEGDFFGEHDKEHNPLPTKPKGVDSKKPPYQWELEDNIQKLGSNEYLGQCRDEWTLRTMLMSGSIIGKGCQGAMKLAGHGVDKEREAYILGGHLALIWQLYLDIKDFFIHPNSFSFVGAPIMFALWEYPTIYSHFLEARLDKKHIEHKGLYYAVKSTRALEYLTIFLDNELATILEFSDKFPVEDARTAIQKMALTIHSKTLQYIE